MSGSIKKHSYDSSKIKRTIIYNYIIKSRFFNLRDKSAMRSYLRAIDNKTIFEYEEGNENSFAVRINPYIFEICNV